MPFTRLPAGSSAATASLYAAARRAGAGAPTIVIDLDETILFRQRGLVDAALLYLWPGAGARVGVPYPSAVAAINHLASRYRFVAVTARWKGAGRGTHGWLAASGLPGMPVILAEGMHPQDAPRAAYKAAAIRHIREEGWNPVLGVGDRPSDMEAYTSEGLRAFMVAHREGGESGNAVRRLRKLRECEARIRARAAAGLGGTGSLPEIRYFSDDPATHASTTTTTTAADAGLGGGESDAPKPHPLPVWTQIQDLLDLEELGGGLPGAGSRVGAADWEEEATGEGFLRRADGKFPGREGTPN
jgi:hypothetical protein